MDTDTPRPTEGGSYILDPKKNTLTQVEKPTVHVGLNDPEPEIEPATDTPAEADKKGK